jgi:putative ABC transport system permease protein
VLVKDIFKLAWRALIDRKIRSVLTILGITIGSAIVLALIASSSGLNAEITSNLEKTGANVLTLQTAVSFFVGGGSSQIVRPGSSSTYQLSQSDVNYLATIPNVVGVYPYYQYPASVTNGGETLQATVVGIDLAALPILYSGLSVAEGSIPPAGDTTSGVVGWSIANPTSGTPLGLNQMISLSVNIKEKPISYAVLARAILAQYGSALLADMDNTVYITLQGAQFLANSPYFSGIYVVVDSTNDVSSVQDAIQTHYRDDVRVMSPSQILSTIQSVTSQTTVFLGSIGAVSLFVATVGIANTMYVSVLERTREIGILKALGYSPKQIMAMFLSEAAITGTLGAMCGFLLGYVLSFLMGGMIGGGSGPIRVGGGAPTIQPIFSIQLVLFALTFPIILATLAGLYPAYRASRMSAINALKHE